MTSSTRRLRAALLTSALAFAAPALAGDDGKVTDFLLDNGMVVQQGLLTGGTVQFVNFERYLNENSPSNLLNPAVAPHMGVPIVEKE